jgi:hypothetical protein
MNSIQTLSLILGSTPIVQGSRDDIAYYNSKSSFVDPSLLDSKSVKHYYNFFDQVFIHVTQIHISYYKLFIFQTLFLGAYAK